MHLEEDKAAKALLRAFTIISRYEPKNEEEERIRSYFLRLPPSPTLDHVYRYARDIVAVLDSGRVSEEMAEVLRRALQAIGEELDR